jgi:hypothetical protein
MEIRFNCKSCTNEIVIRYSKPDDVVFCRNCDTPNIVPKPKPASMLNRLPSIELIRAVVIGERRSKVIFALLGILAGLVLAILDHEPPYHVLGLSLILISAGVILIRRVKRLGTKDKAVEEAEIKKAREILKIFVQTESDPGCGVLKGNVEQTKYIENMITIYMWWLFRHFHHQTYQTLLLPDQAIFIRKDLKDFFVVEKQTAQRWKFKRRGEKSSARLVDSNGYRWTVIFDEPCSQAFKNWALMP